MLAGSLWVVFTIIAAFTQTVRNAMQRELTGSLGTAGATHVRFLFGFPFALAFLVVLLWATGVPLPRPGWAFWPWVIDGAFTQIVATALMLAAMGERSFVVTIAYLKTEPIQVAIFGLIFLGDAVTWAMMTAILLATAGVVIMSTKPDPSLVRMRGRRRVRAAAGSDRCCWALPRAACSRCRRSAFAARSAVSGCPIT